MFVRILTISQLTNNAKFLCLYITHAVGILFDLCIIASTIQFLANLTCNSRSGLQMETEIQMFEPSRML